MRICYIVWTCEEISAERCFAFLERQNFPETADIQAVSVDVKDDLWSALKEAYTEIVADVYIVIFAGVSLLYPDFTKTATELLLKEKEIGLIGLSGFTHLPYDGIFWKGQNLGFGRNAEDIPGVYRNHEICPYAVADGVDDTILVIRREEEILCEDRFCGIYGYGIFLSALLKKIGKSTVVLKQKEAWIRGGQRSIDPVSYEKSRSAAYAAMTEEK